MCRHHAHGHEVYTPAHTEADSWSRFVNQVWKKESPLSLWDSHTCCTGLHTENKSAHSSVVTDRTPQKHTQRRSIRGNHTETYSEGGKKKVHSGTRTNRWARRRSLSLLLHSLNLSVITTDVSLSWFNFSDAWTKSASFRRRKERKKKKKND